MLMPAYAPDCEAERGLPIEEHGEQDGDDDAGDADRRVLPLEERLRALLDRAGDLLHALVAGGQRHDAVDEERRVGDGQHPRSERRKHTELN
jgi:hypothetical protein